jgi:hypothetical protein
LHCQAIITGRLDASPSPPPAREFSIATGAPINEEREQLEHARAFLTSRLMHVTGNWCAVASLKVVRGAASIFPVVETSDLPTTAYRTCKFV